MKRHSSIATCTVAELLVRPTLPYLNKAELTKNSYHLGSFENRNVAQSSRDGDVLNANEL
jgi:hypothetical protein